MRGYGSKAQQGRQVRGEDQLPVLKQAGKWCCPKPQAHVQQEEEGKAEDDQQVPLINQAGQHVSKDVLWGLILAGDEDIFVNSFTPLQSARLL